MVLNRRHGAMLVCFRYNTAKEPLILVRLCTVKIPGAQGGCFLLDDIENANEKAPSGAHLCALPEKEH